MVLQQMLLVCLSKETLYSRLLQEEELPLRALDEPLTTESSLLQVKGNEGKGLDG